MENDNDLMLEKEFLYTNEINYYEECPHIEGKKCYIFFSSNGLYQDSTKEEFQEIMIEKSRYEWKSMSMAFKYHKELGKIIYVRDIYKCFYIYGINEKLSSIDKVIDELRKITVGYEITTVGISSGGYLAVLSAIMLNAKRAFCFSGQFNIEGHLSKEVLLYCKESEEKQKYIDIMNLVRENREVPIYYFCPTGCEHDYKNYMLVKDINHVKCFLFPDRKHAATVYPFNFPDLLFLTNEKLDKLCMHYAGKLIDKKDFYVRTVTLRGIATFLLYVLKSKFRWDLLRKRWDV